MAKQRRNFTREFKVEAVRWIAAEGKSLAEVARELGRHCLIPNCERLTVFASADWGRPGAGPRSRT